MLVFDPVARGGRQGNNREPSDPPSGTPRQLHLAAAKDEEEDDATSKLVEQQQQPPPSSANQAVKHEQGCQDMKSEPKEEAIADPVTAVAQQQPPSLGQGVAATGGGLLTPPATAVYHDQVVQVINYFAQGNLGKFASKSLEGIFVGYGDESHTYRI